MKLNCFVYSLCLGILTVSGCVSTPININRLNTEDQASVERILVALEPTITAHRQKQDLPTLTFEELYAPQTEEDRVFLKSFQSLDPRSLKLTAPYYGVPDKLPDLVVIPAKTLIQTDGSPYINPPQYLPRHVFDAYQSMSEAMRRELGKTLYVASGYRCPAYQLYLFLFYLKNHDYSVYQTARFVAWPGYSEHGSPAGQAIDFVNEQGIDGQNNAAEFEALEEYRWLQSHAVEFGFELSYPKRTSMAFEPWHWHYKGK